MEIIVSGRVGIVNEDAINRDIETLESKGKVGENIGGVYRAPRPNLHGLLTCLRDKRQYSSNEVARVCMQVCPHNKHVNKTPDDGAHLDDCIGVVFEGTSLDGVTKYIDFKL